MQFKNCENYMDNEQLIKFLSAQLVLRIWNPDLWNWYPSSSTRMQMKLYYKTKGIVLHDRVLNGFSDNLFNQELE